MRILFTSMKILPDIGGIETMSGFLLELFSRAGHEIAVVTQTQLNGRAWPSLPPSVRIFSKPSVLCLFRLVTWADVVFQNNIELRVAWPAVLMNKPLVISLHTWIRSASGRRRLVDQLKRLLLGRADAVIAVSDAIKSDTTPRAIVIPNAYNDSVFFRQVEPERTTAVAFVGRLVSDKGADQLIRAFASICSDPAVIKEAHRQGFALSLSIYGDGPEKDSLRELTIKEGIVNRVAFFGARSHTELSDQLNRHLVQVVPSRWAEPFGIVALEGAGCGCVVLGSDAGGLAEAIGPSGMVYRQNDLNDLTTKLALLLKDSKLRAHLQLQAPAHLAQHNYNVVAQRYLDVIDSTAKKRKIRGS